MLHPLTGQSPSNHIILNSDMKTHYTKPLNCKEKFSFNSLNLPAEWEGLMSGMTDTESLSAFVICSSPVEASQPTVNRINRLEPKYLTTKNGSHQGITVKRKIGEHCQ